MLSRNRMVSTLLIAAAVILALGPLQRVWAQEGQELLRNNEMDEWYGIGGINVVPVGWTFSSAPPVSTARQAWMVNENPGYGNSWHVSTQSQVFTMVAYQFVPGVRAATPLRFTMAANLFTCNRSDSCIDSAHGRISDQSSGARVRIGIDPKGGIDANSSNVIWSSFASPFDTFQQLIVDAQSQNDAGVTVFLYATQSTPMLLNNVYWDKASLRTLGPGGIVPTAGGPTFTPIPQFAPFVTPQGAQSDGSIIHVVRPGDTLSSIAVAYKVTVKRIRELNNLPADFAWLSIGQKLIIKPPDPLAAASAAATSPATEPASSTTSATLNPALFGPLNAPTATPTRTRVVIASFTPAGQATAALPATGEPTSAPTATPTPTTPPPLSVPSTQPPTLVALAKEAGICVEAYNDANKSFFRDPNEAGLAGVTLKLNQTGREVKTLTTEASAPVCAANLEPGTYTVLAVPPANYGLTTPGQLQVEVKPGVQLSLVFGAAEGYQPTALPTRAPEPTSLPAGGQSGANSTLSVLVNNSGLIILGVAGLMVVLGVGLFFLLRRR